MREGGRGRAGREGWRDGVVEEGDGGKKHGPVCGDSVELRDCGGEAEGEGEDGDVVGGGEDGGAVVAMTRHGAGGWWWW